MQHLEIPNNDSDQIDSTEWNYAFDGPPKRLPFVTRETTDLGGIQVMNSPLITTEERDKAAVVHMCLENTTLLRPTWSSLPAQGIVILSNILFRTANRNRRIINSEHTQQEPVHEYFLKFRVGPPLKTAGSPCICSNQKMHKRHGSRTGFQGYAHKKCKKS